MASIVSASAAVVNSARNQASAGGCASPMPACRHQSDTLTGLLHSILLVAWGAAGCTHLGGRMSAAVPGLWVSWVPHRALHVAQEGSATC